MKQHTKLLTALISGIVLGVIFNSYSDQVWFSNLTTHILNPIGQIFLRLIFMAIVPLIFSALVLGVLELATGKSMGKVMQKTLLYTLIASSMSVVIGISLANTLKPGSHVSQDLISKGMQTTSDLATIQKNASEAKPFSQIVIELFTKNPVDSAARALGGEIIAFMVFALIFGMALAAYRKETHEKMTVVRVLEEIYGASMNIIGFAMKLAPIGIFCLVFVTISKFGYEILISLSYYVFVVVLGLMLQQFLVYPLLLKWRTKRNPLVFFRKCRDVYLYAFSTASSNATLPLSLETAETQLGISPEISRFVLTVGSTANQNGTALFEGVTVLFLAQVFNVDLSLTQQIQVVVMSILAGIGTAGVPGGSLPLIVLLVQSIGIPVEGIGLILGVDRFLDMCRTTLNVSGDLVIAAVVDADVNKA